MTKYVVNHPVTLFGIDFEIGAELDTGALQVPERAVRELERIGYISTVKELYFDIPTGGVPGQTIVKASEEDRDVTWGKSSGGSLPLTLIFMGG